MYRKPEFTSASESEVKTMENASFLGIIAIIVVGGIVIGSFFVPVPPAH